MTSNAFFPETTDPLRPAGTRAVRPRQAATLILIRRSPKTEPAVLMGRRHRGHDFMPDKWVFPGGRVDRCDFTAPASTELTPETQTALAQTVTARRAHSLPRALAMAAVRETFEEAGLLLARPALGGQHARPGVGGWCEFLAAGAAADLAALSYIARAVTPAQSRKRFDARFFLADAGALISQDAGECTGELGEIDWIPLADTHRLDLPTVTRAVLCELEHRLDDPGRPPLSLIARRGAGGMERAAGLGVDIA